MAIHASEMYFLIPVTLPYLRTASSISRIDSRCHERSEVGGLRNSIEGKQYMLYRDVDYSPNEINHIVLLRKKCSAILLHYILYRINFH